MLSRLVFYGRTNMKIGESAGMIKAILAAASDYSPASGLTGGLVFNEKYMMEVIEGAREQVSKRLKLLYEDPRLEDLTLLAVGAIDRRAFDGWAVGYAGHTIDAERLYLKYGPTIDINPANMSAVAVLDFVREFCALDTLYVQRAGLNDQRAAAHPLPGPLPARANVIRPEAPVETIKVVNTKIGAPA